MEVTCPRLGAGTSTSFRHQTALFGVPSFVVLSVTFVTPTGYIGGYWGHMSHFFGRKEKRWNR